MSVITDPTATPSRIEALYRYMSDRKDESRENLALLLSPPALQRRGSDGDSSGRSVREVLTAGRALGVVEPAEGDDGRLRLGSSLRSKGGLRPLLAHLEEVLLQPGPAEEHGQAEFPRALSWFLAQDPMRPLRVENVQGLLEEQQGEAASAYNLTNPLTFGNFVYWARYLGFAWRLGVDRFEGVVPDPTKSLRRHLSQQLDPGESVPIHVAMERLTLVLPVLEGGASRDDVDQRMAEPFRRPLDRLSRSTSLALTRVDDRRSIMLESLDDARITLLDTPPGMRAVTHIRLLEERQ